MFDIYIYCLYIIMLLKDLDINHLCKLGFGVSSNLKRYSFRVAGGHPGCACAVHSRGSAEQPSSLCQRHRLGPSLIMSHLHGR